MFSAICRWVVKQPAMSCGNSQFLKHMENMLRVSFPVFGKALFGPGKNRFFSAISSGPFLRIGFERFMISGPYHRWLFD